MPGVHPHPHTSALDSFEAVVRDPCRVRHFRGDEVPREDIEHMVDLTLCAASACPTQTWRFIAVQRPSIIRDMQTAVLERFEELALKPGLALQEHKRTAARAQALMFAKAPLCMAVLSLPSSSPMEELMELAGMTRRRSSASASGRSCRARGPRSSSSPPPPTPWATPPAGPAPRSSRGSGWRDSWGWSRLRGWWPSSGSASPQSSRRRPGDCPWSRRWRCCERAGTGSRRGVTPRCRFGAPRTDS